jgi:hypothetical protein
MDEPGKIFELQQIMARVHELTALAWPDQTPFEALGLIIDIQQAVCRALDLPEDLDLTDGRVD